MWLCIAIGQYASYLRTALWWSAVCSMAIESNQAEPSLASYPHPPLLVSPPLLQIVRLKGAASAAAKEAVCLALCGRSFASGRTIIFCKTKTRAHRLKILFGLAKLPPAGRSGVQAGSGSEPYTGVV